MKYKGFTLIELLVVIVIIGILATISTALFNGNKEKVLIAKYQAQRNQASKERYEECLSLYTQHCGPSFVIYKNPLNNEIYKKDTNSISSDPGRLLGTLSGNYSFALSADGKFLIYPNELDNVELYKKDINTFSSDPGIAITNTGGGASLPVVTPDGKYVIYRNIGWDYELRKKDINSVPTDLGTVLTDSAAYPLGITPDGLFVLYSLEIDGILYKKNINSASSDLGEALLDSGMYNNQGSVVVTSDGEFFIYTQLPSGNLYKKSMQSVSSDPGVVFADNTGFSINPSISQEKGVIYRNSFGDNLLYKKNINSTNSDPGIVFAETNGAYPVIFP